MTNDATSSSSSRLAILVDELASRIKQFEAAFSQAHEKGQLLKVLLDIVQDYEVRLPRRLSGVSSSKAKIWTMKRKANRDQASPHDTPQLFGVHVQHLARAMCTYRTTGLSGSRSFRLNNSRRLSSRLIVAGFNPTTSAMRRIGVRGRRRPSILCSVASPTSSLSRFGRELRSSRRASPSASKRACHLLAVRGLIPAASAAEHSPISLIRAINRRPVT